MDDADDADDDPDLPFDLLEHRRKEFAAGRVKPSPLVMPAKHRTDRRGRGLLLAQREAEILRQQAEKMRAKKISQR